MDYGFIDNKDMVMDYHDDEDFILQAWRLWYQVSTAPKNMIVVYQNHWGDYPPTGVSIVPEEEFVGNILWCQEMVDSVRCDEIKKLAEAEFKRQFNNS